VITETPSVFNQYELPESSDGQFENREEKLIPPGVTPNSGNLSRAPRFPVFQEAKNTNRMLSNENSENSVTMRPIENEEQPTAEETCSKLRVVD
jgi:hypothetical protein